MVKKRRTTIGKVKPYIDVQNIKDVPKFESLISTGPITVVLVYAGWCGHCKKLKDEMWDEMANSPNRGVNTAAVHYDMVANTSLKNAPIEGYPTIFEVKPTPKENVSKAIPTPQNKTEMAEILNMNNNPVVNNTRKNISMNTANNMKLNEPMNINAGNNVPADRLQTVPLNSFIPKNVNVLESLPPDMNKDTNNENDAISTVVRSQSKQKGGNLMESLLKIAADSAHAVVLAGSAAELSQRMKKRKAQKSRKQRHSYRNTRKHKRVIKKKTRKNYRKL